MSNNPPNLKEQAYSAVRWTAVSAATGALVQLLQVVMLTRILTPADYGIMAIVAAVLTFPWVLNGTGLNSAFIHRRDVTEGERSSLFWAGVLFALFLGAVVLALAPLIAWLYGDARLLPLLALSSATFLVSGVGAQFRMNAEKHLRFKPMAVIETLAAAASMAVAVLAALNGAGPYTLVWSSLTGAVVNSGLAWRYLSADWTPRWHLSWAELKPYVHFGLAAVSSALISNLNRSLDVMMLGKFVAPADLGLYSVPRNFMNQMQTFVNPILSRVGFPLIASVQAERARVRAITLSTLNLVGALNAPVYVGMALFADPLVRVLFGGEWHGTGHLLAILAVVGYVRAMFSPIRDLILGVGQAGRELRWNLGILAVVLPAIVVGAQFGPQWLALLLAAATLGLLVPAWMAIYHPLADIAAGEFAMLVLRPVGLAALSMVPALLLAQQVGPPLLQLLVGAVVTTPLYLLLNLLANRFFVDALLRLLLPRRATADTPA
ncbi:putative Polysaccharide transporter protein [Thiomonas arsenitoxydans]|uniref:Polysaccharide transporter protein n=1 Tax=Thiomonas arsenitoxydans (strain DSM 22701 / CIP 110005 / 3As) TaxID=426114 RepID=D6CP69_THIA3|nr:MOP flippase family protein [Thiomonas arsenitoxydans]CAZ90347.1 putative Polysaccharide transporter protein [Thiomonas arsenitoxydans]CQR28152.1 putative Polysaccharide transporter protein [Thiomonas arsenitoxydans]CQR28155.1 putative Polysaccharide transporter protein [Thiomonas arsenitoxydans]CQR28698.1 putative Polysaccharide transporter protein [Thiomonas arsenitoxydans]CQR31178.1 putative Polysaccharide transporter protein [Thiomonas arsenitoxydans]